MTTTLAALLMGGSVVLASLDGPGICPDGRAAEALTLAQLWTEAAEREAGYAAADEVVAAESAVRSAIRREWLPRITVDGNGDWGHRLSPGEERVLGAGPREELRMVAAWTLIDGGRGARGLEADRRMAEARVRGEAFDVAYRAQVARLYVEAALAEELWQARDDQRRALAALAEPVRRRRDAGVDVTWEGQLLEESLTRTERRLVEADQARAAARAELSALAGRCVEPAPIAPVAPGAGRAVARPVESPRVRQLAAMADTHDALARVESGRNRWSLQLLGTTGPTRSRAFTDQRTMNEYVLGVSANWTPDLAGLRRRYAESERARARALRADAASLRDELERELGRIAVTLEHASARQALLARELEQTRRALEIAVARWEAGVDRWTEVVRAQEQLEQTRVLQIELAREIALASIRYAEAQGTMTELPQRLGQETTR